jgi:hypothetical protein
MKSLASKVTVTLTIILCATSISGQRASLNQPRQVEKCPVAIERPNIRENIVNVSLTGDLNYNDKLYVYWTDGSDGQDKIIQICETKKYHGLDDIQKRRVDLIILDKLIDNMSLVLSGDSTWVKMRTNPSLGFPTAGDCWHDPGYQDIAYRTVCHCCCKGEFGDLVKYPRCCRYEKDYLLQDDGNVFKIIDYEILSATECTDANGGVVNEYECTYPKTWDPCE